jgi:hypothetical protein
LDRVVAQVDQADDDRVEQFEGLAAAGVGLPGSDPGLDFPLQQ